MTVTTAANSTSTRPSTLERPISGKPTGHGSYTRTNYYDRIPCPSLTWLSYMYIHTCVSLHNHRYHVVFEVHVRMSGSYREPCSGLLLRATTLGHYVGTRRAASASGHRRLQTLGYSRPLCARRGPKRARPSSGLLLRNLN